MTRKPTKSQRKTLQLIESNINKHGHCTIGMLQKDLNYTHEPTRKRVKRLEDRKLIVKRFDPKLGLRWSLHLTAKAKRYLENVAISS